MKRNKRIILCMLFIMTCMFAGAQNYMYVYTNDGSFVEYPVASIEKVIFTEPGAQSAQIETDRNALYDSFMKNVASKGQAAIYSPMRMQFNLMGDDVNSAGAEIIDIDELQALNYFRLDASNVVVEYTYNGFYDAIKDANVLINGYANEIESGNASAPVKEIVAEAKVLRAYMYMMLAIGWGTPPLIESVNDGVLYNCDKDPDKNLSHNDLLKWCAQECESSLDYLPERISKQDREGAYKVTRGFANAIAGKSYLFAGEYEKSKAALKKVIDSGKYDLVAGDKYWENFHVEGDGNEEKIFEPNLEYDPDLSFWSGPASKVTWMEANVLTWHSTRFIASPTREYSGLDGWGGIGVPQWLGDEFFANDGHSKRFDATLMRIDDAVYNMPYSEVRIKYLSQEEKKTSREVGISSEGLFGQSIYLPLKQMPRANDIAVSWMSSRINNYTIMRYAEVLLLYAEACLQTGDAASAKRVINQIQMRAGSKTISETVDMDVLKKEKCYELWFEGARWADQIRWGDTDRLTDKSKVSTLYDKLFRQPGSNATWLPGEDATTGRFYTELSDDPVNTYGISSIGFKEGKHELLPFPASVIESNPNITQNPGW